MTLAQGIYLALIALYAVLFALFLRFFLWKRYAEARYYRRRPSLTREGVAALAARLGRPLPKFTLFVPARNEADVIARTIDHLASLDYPPDRLEIVVATDEKERQAAAAERPALVAAAAALLGAAAGGTGAPEAAAGAEPGAQAADAPAVPCARAEALALALLARLALAEAAAGPLAGAPLPAGPVAAELAGVLWQSRGRLRLAALPGAVREALQGPALPAAVAVAAVAVAAYAALRGEREPQGLHRRLLAAVNRAQALALRGRAGTPAAGTPAAGVPMAATPVAVGRGLPVPAGGALAGAVAALAGRVAARVQALAAGGALAGALAELCPEVFPTTQEIVAAKCREFAADPSRPRLKHVEVPWDFDGNVGGRCTGRFVPSTKGRALNYALAFADPESEMYGYYDAESRPHPQVLLYVAWRRLTGGPGVRLLQGPVFQVRNFYRLGPLCKIVALYQAISHEWYLPVLMRSLPFVGGTNLFIEGRLLRRIGGYDHRCLTEDLELGVRAYLEAGAWPEYLPLPSTEQTPATFRAFFRQRLRWGSGYLQVYEKLKAARNYPEGPRRRLLRNLLLHGQVQWTLYQLVCFLPPIVWFLYHQGFVDPTVLPEWARLPLTAASMVYLLFTYSLLFRYSAHMDRAADPLQEVAGATHLLALPVGAFFLPVPYSSALVLRMLGRLPQGWVKTPRTRE